MPNFSRADALRLSGPLFWLLLSVVVAFGAWFRLDQFFSQVLIDDEWHAVHQLLHSTPQRIALSFGYADYSIPLTLLYWWQASTFGLSEWSMRWPMLLAGLTTLVFLPWLTAQRLNRFSALALALLIAISPLLVVYSQTARPYALTVLLVWLSVWLFYRYCDNQGRKSWLVAMAYAVISALAVWLHLIVALFIAAPFILEAWRLVRLLRKNRTVFRQRLVCLLQLGLPAAMLTLALVLPPLLHDAGSLLSKTHKHHISLDTVMGTWHLWLGTSAWWLALIALILAIAGLFSVLRRFPEAVAVGLGALLTFALVTLMQPAWINHPQVLARYLLPALPLILLFIAAGFDQLRQWMGNWPTSLALLAFVLAIWLTSPLPDLLQTPNSHKTHAARIDELRPGKNETMAYMRQRPISPFWKALLNNPAGSLTIAAAPFSYQEFHWDAIFWEPASGQRVIPGFVLGLCANQRHGEVPANNRFHFNNVAYLASPQDLKKRGIDFILWQKPAYFGPAAVMTHKNLTGCGEKIRALYGPSFYEDNKIAVYSVTGKARHLRTPHPKGNTL